MTSAAKKQHPQHRLGDEDKAASIPAGIEGEEGADSVVVGPVKEDVAEGCDESSEIDPLPSDGLRPGTHWGSGFRRRSGFSSTGATAFDPAVVEPGGTYRGRGNEGHGDESVGDAAMVLETFDGAGKSPDDVEVGGFGGEHGSQRGVGSFAIESGASDAGAGQEVGDGFHSVLEFMVAE